VVKLPEDWWREDDGAPGDDALEAAAFLLVQALFWFFVLLVCMVARTVHIQFPHMARPMPLMEAGGHAAAAPLAILLPFLWDAAPAMVERWLGKRKADGGIRR